MTIDRGVTVVAMRLVDMVRVHPAQDNSRVCSKCGQRVGLYPTGIAALKACPEATVVCVVCVQKDWKPGDEAMSCGTVAEILQEARESKDVGKA